MDANDADDAVAALAVLAAPPAPADDDLTAEKSMATSSMFSGVRCAGLGGGGGGIVQ